MTFNIEPFSNQAFQLGEGPHWHNEKLYFVDILGGLAATIDVNGKYELLHRENDYITAVLPVEGDDQRLVLSTKSDLYLLNVKTGHKVLVDAIKTEAARFNDGKCDSKHKLWIGTMGLESEPGKLAPERGLIKVHGSNSQLDSFQVHSIHSTAMETSKRNLQKSHYLMECVGHLMTSKCFTLILSNDAFTYSITILTMEASVSGGGRRRLRLVWQLLPPLIGFSCSQSKDICGSKHQ